MRGDGCVIQRKDSPNFWIQFCVRGKVHRERGGRTPAEARRRLKARIQEIQAGRFVGLDQERRTVNEELDSYEKWLVAQEKKSLVTTRAHLKPIRAEFGDRPIVSVRPSDFEQYRDTRLRARKTKRTIDHELGSLRAALRRAQKEERLTRVVHIPMYGKAADVVRQGFVERETFEAIAANLPDLIRDIARFAFLSAWRRGEILGLRWEWVDRAAREVRLPDSKNGKPRVLPLEGQLWTLIERRWAARHYERPNGETSLSLLVFHRGGCPIADFRKVWQAACAKANVPATLFHDLRRSGIRNLVRAGVPVAVAKKISGHETDSVFDRYNITSVEDQRAALRVTEAYLEGQAEESNVARFPQN
jgi:integrase